VPDLIEALHLSATKAARRARRSGEAADFHRTRIRLKRLRYALEFVSEIYERRTARYLRHVVKLQDGLGLMQDARVAAARLHELATARGSTLSPTTLFVMGSMTERYRMESERLAHKVPALLHELGGSEWRKLTSLMERRRLEFGAQYRWPSPSPPPPTFRPTPTPQGPAPGPSADPTPAPTPTDAATPEPLLEREVRGPQTPAVWTTDPVVTPDPTPTAPVSSNPGPGHSDERLYPSSNGEGPHGDSR
jgi:hypothetical protein